MTFYTFANATTSIPLANLDANFATPITLGNTAVTINGTFSSIGNLTLNNATIASGNSTVTKETVTTITSPAATNLTIQSAGTTAMTIDASQNVGIGTTSPGYKLDVASGDTVAGQAIRIRANSTAAKGGLQFTDSAASSQYGWIKGVSTGLSFYGGGNASGDVFIDSSGRLLVGTTSASGSKLQADGTGGAVNATASTTAANASLALSSSNGLGTATMLFAGIGSSSYAWLQGQNTGDNSYKDIVINPNGGNLLVGTTSTTSVNAGIAIIPNGSSGTTGYVRIGHSSATSGQGYLDFLYNNSIIGSVQQAGTTGVSFNTSSDYRLKENVTPMTTGLEKISALKPVTYDWISDKSYGEGFIAHELAEIIPYAVTGEKDAVNGDGSIKPQGVDYSKIVVHLVAAIQELKAEFDAYKASHP